MNLIELLRKRQMFVTEYPDQEFKKSLKDTKLYLNNILDREKELLKGHVILGFTWDGEFLLSYKLQVELNDEEDVTDREPFLLDHHYSIHWWRVSLRTTPLKLVHSADIFKGYCITEPLRLSVCQPKYQSLLTIFGCKMSCQQQSDPYTCYISIISSPLAHELFPPFPVLCASLSLGISNSLLINSGCGLFFISHNLLTNELDSETEWAGQWVDPVDSWCTISKQAFTSENGVKDSLASVDQESHQLLLHSPLEVYVHQQSPPPSHYSCCDNVYIIQRTLDIESWLHNTLPNMVSEHAETVHSIENYDVQLLEVDEKNCEVIFIVVAMVELSLQQGYGDAVNDDCSFCKCQVTMSASWSISRGRVTILQYMITQIHTTPATISRKKWCPGSKLFAQVLRRLKPHHSFFSEHIHVLSNQTVLSHGKSLRALRHPNLPLILLLTVSTRSLHISHNVYSYF